MKKLLKFSFLLIFFQSCLYGSQGEEDLERINLDREDDIIITSFDCDELINSHHKQCVCSDHINLLYEKYKQYIDGLNYQDCFDIIISGTGYQKCKKAASIGPAELLHFLPEQQALIQYYQKRYYEILSENRKNNKYVTIAYHMKDDEKSKLSLKDQKRIDCLSTTYKKRLLKQQENVKNRKKQKVKK